LQTPYKLYPVVCDYEETGSLKRVTELQMFGGTKHLFDKW